MSFTQDVNATRHLQGSLCQGLGALLPADRARISHADPGKLLGSVDVDAALKDSQPNAARWDYLVGEKQGQQQRLHWIEVHPASSTGNVGEIGAKLDWLIAWLRTTPLASYPKKIVWIASGKSAFNARDPGVRALARRGLYFAGSHLKL